MSKDLSKAPRVTLLIPSDMHSQMQEMASRETLTVSDIARRAIRHELRRDPVPVIPSDRNDDR